MQLISDIDNNLSNINKKFDISVTSSTCSFCIIGQICTSCCKNSNKMNDTLFFKVWRNIVIRKLITGEEMIEKLKPKNDVMEIVIDNLKYYQVNYDRNYIFDQVKQLKNITDVKSSAQLIVEPFFTKIMEFKQNQISNGLLNEDLIVRLKSERVKQYIQTIDPYTQSGLPPLFEIIEKEKQEINEIISNIKLIFELEGIEYRGLSYPIKNFISKCKENYEDLIFDELNLRYEEKKRKLTRSLEKFQIFKHKYQNEIDKYLNTYKIAEIKSNNVWSHNRIVYKERYSYYKENHSTINLLKVLEELNKHDIPYRQNSEIIKDYINFLPPKQFFFKDYQDNNNNNNDDDDDDDDFFNCLEEQFKLNGLSIDDIIQHENDTIISIIKILESEFNLHDIQFNVDSDRVQSFISNTSSLNCDSFNKQLSSLLSIEKSFIIKSKMDEFKNQLKIHDIQNPKYPDQHSKYLNSLCQFSNSSFDFKNHDVDIWSPETIIKKELEAKSRINNLITSLRNVGITLQINNNSNKLVNDYIYNRDKNGNELSIESSICLLNEIIKKENEQQDQTNQQDQQEQDYDEDEYFEDYEDYEDYEDDVDDVDECENDEDDL
ncbi:hypothetical protein ACTFIZ_008811 [Dictyostelium cf. discoideum]